MAEIVTPIADALMDTGDNLTGFLSLTAPAFLPCEFALRFGERLLFFAEEARIFEEFAIREGSKGFQTNVNANGLRGRRQAFDFDFLAEAGKPLAIDTANGAGFEFAPRPAVKFIDKKIKDVTIAAPVTSNIPCL